MDLAAIQTKIGDWLNVTAVDPDQDPPVPLRVGFNKSPRNIRTKPHVIVNLGPITKLGHDVKRYTYDDLTDEYVEQMWGVRRMILRLDFISFSQAWGKQAHQYAEDWRIRAQSTRSIAELGHLALERTGELIDLDYEWSGRMVSRTQVDAQIGLWGYERRSRVDEGYIKNVNIEGERTVIDEWQNTVITADDEYPIITEDNITTINVSTDD